MKAAMRDRYGGPETVEIRDVEVPVPTEDRLLVEVHAASVNRADLDGLGPRWQFTRLLFGIRAPRIKRLGLDVAAGKPKGKVVILPATDSEPTVLSGS